MVVFCFNQGGCNAALYTPPAILVGTLFLRHGDTHFNPPMTAVGRARKVPSDEGDRMKGFEQVSIRACSTVPGQPTISISHMILVADRLGLRHPRMMLLYTKHLRCSQRERSNLLQAFHIGFSLRSALVRGVRGRGCCIRSTCGGRSQSGAKG